MSGLDPVRVSRMATKLKGSVVSLDYAYKIEYGESVPEGMVKALECSHRLSCCGQCGLWFDNEGDSGLQCCDSCDGFYHGAFKEKKAFSDSNPFS